MVQYPMNIHSIAFASDHRGFALKSFLLDYARSMKIKVRDLGPDNDGPVDYPDFAMMLANDLAQGEVQRGVLICGTGIGMRIAANRHHQIRAALCHDVESVKLTRQHNDANVLALSGFKITEPIAAECLEAFLNTSFEGGRHAKRVAKLS